MKRSISSLIIASLVIQLFLLGGCATSQVTTVPLRREPTTVQVTRVNKIPLNHYPPFPPRTITDVHTVQQLYEAIQALPKLNLPPVMFCPIDLGLEYHLTFSWGNNVIQQVIIYPGGCRRVQIGASDLRVLTEPFIHLFVQTIGITEPKLAPMSTFDKIPQFIFQSSIA